MKLLARWKVREVGEINGDGMEVKWWSEVKFGRLSI